MPAKRKSPSQSSARQWWSQALRSVWFFPAILTVVLVLLTALQISGSSVGMYHEIFYGDTSKDRNLIANEPRPIRSDEWLVNTQMAIAQKENGFQRVNQNIGNGEDVSVMADVPYTGWSAIFRPQNLSFLVLPLDNALAFKWWVMGYLLILGCYFFILTLLPRQRLLAALLSLGLFFTPFVQWWYIYPTLGTMAYCFFGAGLVIRLLRERSLKRSLLWGGLLAYVMTCFALVLYPPFQIPCALATLAFVLGYIIEQSKGMPRKLLLQKLGVLAGSLAVSGGLVLTFLATRLEVVRTTLNTAYPGNRVQSSGGYDAAHLFSSHLGGLLQDLTPQSKYYVRGLLSNQSEASSFLLLIPFLLVPVIYVLYKLYKKQQTIDWPLALVSLAFVGFLAWLFVPHLDPLGKLTMLKSVPHARIIVGFGVLNLLLIVLFIRAYSSLKDFVIKRQWAILYCLAILALEIWLGHYISQHSVDFIRLRWVLLLAIPLPVATYLLLRKQFVAAAGLLLAFGFTMTLHVNPLYRSSDIITASPLSASIQAAAPNDGSKWAGEGILLENFALLNGQPSLSGVYAYPQLQLWRTADPTVPESTYNRYAHINFAFDRDPSEQVPTKLVLVGNDNIGVVTEPCSDFLHQQGVRHLIVGSPLSPKDSCATLVKKISYPAQKLYIYKLD